MSDTSDSGTTPPPAPAAAPEPAPTAAEAFPDHLIVSIDRGAYPVIETRSEPTPD